MIKKASKSEPILTYVQGGNQDVKSVLEVRFGKAYLSTVSLDIDAVMVWMESAEEEARHVARAVEKIATGHKEALVADIQHDRLVAKKGHRKG